MASSLPFFAAADACLFMASTSSAVRATAGSTKDASAGGTGAERNVARTAVARAVGTLVALVTGAFALAIGRRAGLSSRAAALLAYTLVVCKRYRRAVCSDVVGHFVFLARGLLRTARIPGAISRSYEYGIANTCRLNRA